MPLWGLSSDIPERKSELDGPLPNASEPPEGIRFDPVYGLYGCVLCDVDIGGTDRLDQHIESRKHRNKLWWADFERAARDPTLSRMGDPELGIPAQIECRGKAWFRCAVCDVTMWDADTVIQHCSGRRHRCHYQPDDPPQAEKESQTVLETPIKPLRLPPSGVSISPYSTPTTITNSTNPSQSPLAGSPISEWGSSRSASPLISFYDGPASPMPDEKPYKVVNGRALPHPPSYSPGRPSDTKY